MERQLTGSDVVTAGLESLRHDMYHCYPATVAAYYPATETVDVQMATNDVRIDVDTGARISEPWALAGVPVGWLRFGGFVVKGTLAVHDPVILTAFDLDPTAAFAAGRTLKPVDPADVRRHGGGYWYALPINLLVGRPQGAVTGTLTIGVEGGAPLITISGSTIQLGGSAVAPVAPVALATAIDAFIKACIVGAGSAGAGLPAAAALAAAVVAFGTSPAWATATTGATYATAQ